MNNRRNEIFRAKTKAGRALLLAVLVLPMPGAAFGLPSTEVLSPWGASFRQLAQVPYQGSAELAQQINGAVAAESRGDYATVASLLPAAIHSAQLELGHNHALTALLINKLGKAYKETGRFPEAEAAYREALQARLTGLGYDHPDVAETMNHMGVLYELSGRLPESLQLHSDALSIRRALTNLPRWVVAQSLHNLGSVLIRMSRLREAETHLLESLYLLSAAEGQNDLKVKMSTIEHLIALYTRQGRHDEGEVLQANLQQVRASLGQLIVGQAGTQHQAGMAQPAGAQRHGAAQPAAQSAGAQRHGAAQPAGAQRHGAAQPAAQSAGAQRHGAAQPMAPMARQEATSFAQLPPPVGDNNLLSTNGDPLLAAQQLLADAEQRLAALSAARRARPPAASPSASPAASPSASPAASPSASERTRPVRRSGAGRSYLVTINEITSEAESRVLAGQLLESGISASLENDTRKPRFWRLVLGPFPSHRVAISMAVGATQVIGRTAAVEEAKPIRRIIDR